MIFIFDQLPGLLSLSSTFVPTVMNLLKKLAEEGQQGPQRNATTEPHSHPTMTTKSIRNNSSNDLTSTASSGVTGIETGGGEKSSRSKEE